MLAVAGSVLEVCHLSALLFVLRKRYCKGAEAIDDKFQVFLQGNMSDLNRILIFKDLIFSLQQINELVTFKSVGTE